MRLSEHQDAQRGSSGGRPPGVAASPGGGQPSSLRAEATSSRHVRVPRAQRADSAEASESERRVACCQAMRDGWLVP